jgi:hypothetical protein
MKSLKRPSGKQPKTQNRNVHNQPSNHSPQIPQHRLGRKTRSRNPQPSGNSLCGNGRGHGEIQPVLRKSRNATDSGKPTRTHVTHALQRLETLGLDTALMASTCSNEQKLEQTGTQQIIALLTELSQHDGSIRRRLASMKDLYPKHADLTQKISTYNTQEPSAALKKLDLTSQTKTYLFWNRAVAVDHCGSTPRLRLRVPNPTLVPAPP